ncbi:MAG: Smr/MutS family protein [Xanthomonadaceae bacterium]|nr:Smr/MutS family protein [Xanthomonadaceae bacterium]
MSLSSEWNECIDHALKQARSEPARAGLDAFKNESMWASDLISAQSMQQETAEMMSLLEREGLWSSLLGLADPIPVLAVLKRGQVLNTAELVLMRSWLYALDQWCTFPRDDLKLPLFKKTLSMLHEPAFELKTLNRILTPGGEISEKASPTLARLSGELRAVKVEIEKTLDDLVNRYSTAGHLQDRITDHRDGRYVLAVKISEQSEVEGIVYDSSVSKQTVYIEPKEIELLNNQLKRVQHQVEQEIYKILEQVSAELKPLVHEMESSFGILIHWDMAQARARFGRQYGGKPLTIVPDLTLSLQMTAHPLLWFAMDSSQIIRNSVDLGEKAKTLLITGPNTGGKTVFLKTIGLAMIAGRTGFLFPGTDRLLVPFIERFFVDLGDAQSIEKKISSFSGHVLKFKEILENLTPRSLVLLDELNSATDPQEGAALARALLETLIDRGAMLVATTHDPYLKGLALEDPRILSASMEFNESSALPTFKMMMGSPGRSRALETAERLGLDSSIIAKARGFLTKGQLEFESLLSRLEREAMDTQKLRNEAQFLKDQAMKLKDKWEEKSKTTIEEMLTRTRTKLKQVLEKAQDEVRFTVKKIVETKDAKSVDRDRRNILSSVERAESLIDEIIEGEAPEISRALKSKSEARTEPVDTGLTQGEVVRVKKFKSLATVMSVDGGRLKVVLGHPTHQSKSSLTMTVGADEIERLTDQELRTLKIQSGRGGAASVKTQIESDFTMPQQLDLRGKRYDMAMHELEKYLDRAFRSGRAEVTIVHGLGTGTIRQGTLELLKSLPYIKSYYDGGTGRGGDGATVVEFARN